MALNNVPSGNDLPNDFNVIIAIPMHSDPIKYEVDKESGDKNLNALIENYTAEEPKEVKKPKATPNVNVQDRIDSKARQVAGQIDDIFEDEVWFNPKSVDANTVYNFLHSKNVSGIVANRIAEIFTPHLEELKSIKKDEQLKEAYSAFTPKDIKRFIAFYQDVVDTCANYSVNTKKARKPRAKKAVSADKKVGGLKYKLYNPFQLASVNPSKIIGATQVWLFDTKYTKLTMLTALDRGGLDIKGQTSCTWIKRLV